jgi:hypothetical protein
MRKIAEIENGTLNVHNSYSLYWAYQETQERKNQYLDFSEYIRNDEIDVVFSDLKRCGIKTFTVSSNNSGVMENLAAFTERGCKIAGMVVINGRKRFGEHFEDVIEQRNAILVKMPR